MNNNTHISTKEAVRIALITPLHLRSLIRKGEIAGKKNDSGEWAIERQSVEEYAQKRQEQADARIQRIRNGEYNTNIRPTTATANRMRKKIEDDTQLTKELKEAFLTAVNRYELAWDQEYTARKEKSK